jgi:hypothetical protein
VAVYHGEEVYTLNEANDRMLCYYHGDLSGTRWSVKRRDCNNAKFIARARQDIPALLDYIAQLEAAKPGTCSIITIGFERVCSKCRANAFFGHERYCHSCGAKIERE